MFRFIKQLAKNLQQGPATEDYPRQESVAPKRFRGTITIDVTKCVACGICKHVCAGRAINIKPDADKLGYSFSIWHNSCALCGMCKHYCPTGAITHTQDWHTAHLQTEKYEKAEHHFIPYLRCKECGEAMRMLPPDLAAKAYANWPFNMTKLMRLCPDCRALATAKRFGKLQTGEDKSE